jgi:hypothetical protein
MRTVARAVTLSLVAAAGMVGLPTSGGAAAARPITLALIGDVPYGADQDSPTAVPKLIASINADPDVTVAVHLGDIKNGASRCSSAYFRKIQAQFQTFADPLVYTPGDNEWTDCHKASAGVYLPTERLERVREIFYPEPGYTLGANRLQVVPQSLDPDFGRYVENVRWEQDGIVFGTVHTVGSNNGRAVWFDGAETPQQTATRLAEVADRTRAALAWMDVLFDRAAEIDAAAVVIGSQADPWDPTSIARGWPLDGFDPLVAHLASRSAAYGKPVFWLAGDSHVFKVDRPLAEGSPLHGVTTEAPNVTRVIVQGETAAEWLRVRIVPAKLAQLTWERIPVDG